MKHIVTYTNSGLSTAQSVSIPGDFPYYRRGKFYTEIELTLETTGTVPSGSSFAVTAKRIGSTDDLTPEDNSTITTFPASVTYFGSFSEITVTPNATFEGGSATYKIIINAGETC